MAWGRKKSGGRKEPQFGLAASLSELRLGPQDRVPSGDDEPKKKPSAKRKASDSDDDAPRERKPRAKPRRAASASPKRAAAAASAAWFYWGAVLGLWAVIAAVGVVIWVGAHLPAIQSLEIPKRPPTIQIVGFDGSVLATRGEMAGANVALKDLPPHLPKAFIAIEDRRFYSHYGVDPDRHRARGRDQRPASRRLAGRLDADPAARQEPVPDPGAHLHAQIAGSRTGAVAGAQAFQIRDSRTLSQPGLFRLRRLWRRGRGAALFRQAGQERHDRRGRDAGGPGQIAVAAGAEPQSGRRREARPDRADRDGGRQIHHRRAGARPRSGSPPTM